MRDRLDGVAEPELRRALCAWDVDAVSLAYAPVGFGDYHWTALDARGWRWFVTVADLTRKVQYGAGVADAWDGLGRAMDTAFDLRNHGKLDFVVAPLRTAAGETLRRLGSRYAVSVFPFVDGAPGDFGQALSSDERGLVLDMLAALHRAAPPASAPALLPDLSTRATLETGLDELGRPWHGGPFAERARALVSDGASALRRRLDEFDRRAGDVTRAGRKPVVTHGEPHPGNVLRLGERRMLVDWDTVGLAMPERDLWSVAEDPDDLARYAEASGRRPDPSTLALYRLRWDLDEVAVYIGDFRSPHGLTSDTEQAWTGLAGAMERLTGGKS